MSRSRATRLTFPSVLAATTAAALCSLVKLLLVLRVMSNSLAHPCCYWGCPFSVGRVKLNVVDTYERDNAALQAAGGFALVGSFQRNWFWLFSPVSYDMPATPESLRALRHP